MLCSAHALMNRSVWGPGTSTELAHRRVHISSNPSNRAASCAHDPDGYRGMKVSGKTASLTPSPAASPKSRIAFATDASASSITGVAWMAAMRTVVPDMAQRWHAIQHPVNRRGVSLVRRSAGSFGDVETAGAQQFREVGRVRGCVVPVAVVHQDVGPVGLVIQ